MLTLSTDTFDIQITDNNLNHIDDLMQYDAIYLEPSIYKHSSTQNIKIFSEDTLLKSILIGGFSGGTSVYKNSALIQEQQLITCCSNMIFCLSIPDLSLIWTVEVEWATCFGIYKMKCDYIVHGETTITRINRLGEIIWQQGGADIFITIDGDNIFYLENDQIIVKDFQNSTYVFDYHGNQVSYTKA